MEEIRHRLARDLDGTFPELVRLLQNDLYSGLRRLAGADAEDITQEAFIRAYQALTGYPPARIKALAVKPWIWTIALNLGRNHMRDQARRPQKADSVAEPASVEPIEWLSWEERLGSLTLNQRRAVVLRHVVGLDYSEIAEATERPVGTVKADVHRGIERLRQLMEEEK